MYRDRGVPVAKRSETSVSDPSRRRKVLFLGVSGAVLLAVTVAFRGVLKPFFFGALLAYVLHPVVGALTRVTVSGRGLPRWAAVLVIYTTLIGALFFSLFAFTPRVVSEVRGFAANDVPALRRDVVEAWKRHVQPVVARAQGIFGSASQQRAAVPVPGGGGGGGGGGEEEDTVTGEGQVRIVPSPGGWNVVLPAEGVEVVQVDEHRWRLTGTRERRSDARGDFQRQVRRLGEGHVVDVLRVGRGIIGGVIGGIFSFFLTLMISAYLLVTEDRVLGFCRSLVRPASREAFDALLRRLDRGLSGVVRGQLIICMVNGSLSAVGFALADVKYWPTLALIATVFSLVPIFGTIMSSVPVVAVALTQSFGTGLFVFLWIIGIHQVEANLLNPKIMGDAAKIHPVLVVFALLAGEHAFGIVGALLAVPAMSVVQSLFLHFKRYALDYGEGMATDSTV